jgi:hypothetical protein
VLLVDILDAHELEVKGDVSAAGVGSELLGQSTRRFLSSFNCGDKIQPSVLVHVCGTCIFLEVAITAVLTLSADDGEVAADCHGLAKPVVLIGILCYPLGPFVLPY